MKRWAILTVLLYALVLVILTLPVLFTFAPSGPGKGSWEAFDSPGEALEIFTYGGYWVWLAVLTLCQALLLLVPIDVAERRVRPRRKLLVPVITASFLLANLALAGLFCVLCLLFKDDAFEAFALWTRVALTEPAQVPAARQAVGGMSNDWAYVAGLLGILGFLWVAWGLVFYRMTHEVEPRVGLARIARWLVRGSILELLVAVPSHVIVRQRGDCCAPAGTFWGIVTGLALMLLAFGPGVYFLFVERFGRLRPAPTAPGHAPVDASPP